MQQALLIYSFFQKNAYVPLQCLERCRAELCSVLGLQPSQLELSMGMSGDFEQAVCAVLPCCNKAWNSRLTSACLTCTAGVCACPARL